MRAVAPVRATAILMYTSACDGYSDVHPCVLLLF